jgi:hypothetical protein
MTRSEQLRQEAAIHEREAGRLLRRASRLADKGCVFMAADLSELAVRERAFAAQCRVAATNHEPE